MAPRLGYKERYCAFVDILGFGRLVSELAAGNAKYSLLKNLLSTIQSPIHEDRHVFRDTDFRAQSISDAIALSSATTPQGLWQLLSTLERITLQLLAEGYFVRGAVVRDRLYHDDRMVFGQALVKAYALEAQIVKFPRIMLASPVGTYVLNHPKIGPLWRFGFKDRVRAADDGPLFLHVLRRMTSDLQEEMKRKSGVSFGRNPDWKLYAKMGGMLRQRLTESMDNPRHFEKVKWFAAYWNESIPANAKEVERITGFGLDPRSAVFG